MASEKAPLLGRRSHYGLRDQASYQTFYGAIVSRRIAPSTTWKKDVYKAVSGVQFHLKVAGQAAVRFKTDEPESVTRGCYRDSAAFDNDAFISLQGPPLSTLAWLSMPTTHGLENCPLPPFSVQSNADAVEEVRVIVHSCQDGAPRVKGSLRKRLQPQYNNEPSVATFHDIAIQRAGKYVLEVRGVGHPQFSVLATLPLIIDANMEAGLDKTEISLLNDISRVNMLSF